MTRDRPLQAVVVGGGAAGLLAAGTAARRGCAVTVVEKNERPARKVGITGKGRCNVTNDCSVQACVEQVPRNGRFLYSAFSAFTPQDTQALFESLGVPLKVERGSRVFPVSDRARDIVDALVRFAETGGARICRGRVTGLILRDGVCAGVRLEGGGEMAADAVIVCTGGLSYPATGSTGDGYALARQAGHTVVPPRPSLVPLVSGDPCCGELQGLSLRNCTLRAVDNVTGKTVYEELGELLFTHFGVSGPLVLSASAHLRDMAPGRYTLWIDLKPGLPPEKLDARLVRDLEAYKNLHLSNALPHLLPRSLIGTVLRRARVSGEKPCNAVTREERQRLGAVCKAFAVPVEGFRPIEEAVVTAGGVDVREIEAKTMASKKVWGLYFAGEVLDVDAYTGGFNLQIAFSTGAAAGRGIVQRDTRGETSG